MPREGENLLPRFIRAVADQEIFTFGTPWLSDGRGALVLPILTNTSRLRRYVLAEEVADTIRAEDLGRIDRLRVRNDSGSRVFVRPGMLFRGRETQSRGTTGGVLLDPQSTADIEVKCVHASQAISAGALLELAREPAPDIVYQALLSRDQGLIWASVDRVVGAPSEGVVDDDTRTPQPRASDDLVGFLAKSSSGSAADDVLRRIPTHESQCGLIILNADGVIAAEVFDSPESWRVASPAILKRHAKHLQPTRASPLKATADPEAAVRLAKDFLSELGRAEGERVDRHSWTVRRPPASYTAMDGEVIHLVAFRPGASWQYASTMSSAAGSHALDGVPWPIPQMVKSPTAEDAEVAVAESVAFDLGDDSEPSPPRPRPPRRKVLTSGWDTATFRGLEHFSAKEFRRDRSAAVRFLVRHGLRRRGYMGPQVSRSAPATTSPFEWESAMPAFEARRTCLETRIHDFERIAQTAEYAGWLRERARLELEGMASTTEDESLRVAARSALDRLAPPPISIEPPEPAEIETPPAAPPVDVRGLLRRALVASADSKYPQALALLDEALEAEPDNVTALLGRAVAFRRAGKAQEALADLDLVLRLQPNNAAALLNRGRILQERGDLKGALDAFDLLVAVAPTDWDVWMARGDVLAKVGRHEDALRAFAEALRRNPGNEQLQRRVRALEKPRIAPASAESPRPGTPRGVEEGQSYLVKEKRPELSYRTFRALAAQSVPSLLITLQPAERVRQEHGLANVRVLRLGHVPGGDAQSPTALPALAKAIERFVEENQGRGVILLESLDYLLGINGFRDTVLFVEHVNEFILQRRAILLLPVDPDALPEKESALLERNLRILA